MTLNDDRGPSWLCPQAADRIRLLDMDERLRPVRRIMFAVLAAALLASGHWVGWWTIAPLAAAVLGFRVIEHGLSTARHPENRIATAWVFSQLVIAASIALTGGPRSPAIAWLAIPAVSLAARFTARGVAAGAAISVILMMAVTVGVHPAVVASSPQLLVLPLALLVAIIVMSTALMESDVHHRGEAVIDPLTGMLNRNALRSRVRELSEQAAIIGQPVGLVVGDIDHFKRVNDEHGHPHGDAVLKDVAYRIRKHLRAYDLAYRLGGEEFVVLIPGARMGETGELAERLRESFASTPTVGLDLTMSFGAATSETGHLDFDEVFARADAALYEAKEAGRNRVRIAGDPVKPAGEPLLATA